MKPIAQRIAEQLEALGFQIPGGPENMAIGRTRAGRLQRDCGAWSWFLVRRDDGRPAIINKFVGMVGSQWPASEIARGFLIQEEPWGDISLDPPNQTEILERIEARKKAADKRFCAKQRTRMKESEERWKRYKRENGLPETPVRDCMASPPASPAG